VVNAPINSTHLTFLDDVPHTIRELSVAIHIMMGFLHWRFSGSNEDYTIHTALCSSSEHLVGGEVLAPLNPDSLVAVLLPDEATPDDRRLFASTIGVLFGHFAAESDARLVVHGGLSIIAPDVHTTRIGSRVLVVEVAAEPPLLVQYETSAS
jgi:hypothetical protein